MISFKELEIPRNCDIREEVERISGLTGSIFPVRAEELKRLELAKDNVKYQLGKLEMETHTLGYIPVEGDPDKKIKITGAAMTAYANSHPIIKQARDDRAQAEHDYSNILGIVTAFNKASTYLELIMKDTMNEFHGGPRGKSSTLIMN